MKQKTYITTEYIASDGKSFNNYEDCRLYESENEIPLLYLVDDNYNGLSRINCNKVYDYIDSILGQFNLITDKALLENKVQHMLTNLKKELEPYQ